MSNLDDRKSNIIDDAEAAPFAERTRLARESLARRAMKQERRGYLIGMAAGGFGDAVSGGWLAAAVKYIPIVAASGVAVLILYSLGLAVA